MCLCMFLLHCDARSSHYIYASSRFSLLTLCDLMDFSREATNDAMRLSSSCSLHQRPRRSIMAGVVTMARAMSMQPLVAVGKGL